MGYKMLTKEMLNELFDYRDGELYWKVASANRIKIGSQAGWADEKGYKLTQIKGKFYRCHRIVFLMHHGYLPEQIDHINGVKNDNRVENLRAATHAENNRNVGLRKDNTSGVKGVCWHKQCKKWQVRLKAGEKHIHLGLFADLELAELVVMEARDKYHKEFARHA